MTSDPVNNTNSNEEKANENANAAAEPAKLDLTKKLTLDRVVLQDGGFVIDGAADQTPTSGTRIFLRTDYNVPLNADDQSISDDTRIRRTVPTIQHLLSMKPKRIVITSHLGRPKGTANPKLSLKPVAVRLQELLSLNVVFVENWFRDGFNLDEHLNQYDDGTIVLLENCRFYVEEEGKGLDADGNKVKADPANVDKFRALLTSLCDLYVNDAFGTCHRAHSTMVGCQIPLKAAGLLVKKELEYFDKALANPQRPYLAILGGAKVSDKILVIESLLDKVDEMIIAGGMCFTFIKVLQKKSIGASLYDEAGALIVERLMKKAKERNVNIILPVDFVCGDSFSNDSVVSHVDISADESVGIPDGHLGLDVGPKSVALIQESILRSKTVIFNGPPGVFEFSNFESGTKAMIAALVDTTKNNGAITIVGGGDSAASVNKYGASADVSHVSTGGGASLELLEGKLLPGVVNLTDL